MAASGRRVDELRAQRRARWRRCARGRCAPPPRPRRPRRARPAPCWRPWRSRCRPRRPGCPGAASPVCTALRHGQGDVGIVHRLGREGAEVAEPIAEAGQERLDLFLQGKPPWSAPTATTTAPGAAAAVDDADAAGGRQLARPGGDDRAEAGGQLASRRDRLDVLGGDDVLRMADIGTRRSSHCAPLARSAPSYRTISTVAVVSAAALVTGRGRGGRAAAPAPTAGPALRPARHRRHPARRPAGLLRRRRRRAPRASTPWPRRARCSSARTRPSPITLPAHASLFTGLLPPAHGVRGNGAFALAPGVATLAEALRGNGRRTAAFVGGLPARAPLRSRPRVRPLRRPRWAAPSGVHYEFAERRADAVVDAAVAWLAGAARRRVRSGSISSIRTPRTIRRRRSAGGDPYRGEIAAVDAARGPAARRLGRARRGRRWSR